MAYGCCHLSLVPVRADANDASEMVTQLLFGDVFEILEQTKKWTKIRNAFDAYEGWIDSKQCLVINLQQFKKIKSQLLKCSTDLVEYVQSPDKQLIPVVLGSSVNGLLELNYDFDVNLSNGKIHRDKLVPTALLYLNAPYIWGGMSPFGIDCSGFTQMVYKSCGIQLRRDSSQQAQQGENLSFIEEAQPGDLAFFDNEEGKIIHVGILMKNNYIIHAHGKVRIDRLDHTGIFNAETKNYSHQLRVIKHI
ncbi:C40 family peptidase [Mesohalobacter halotolerans]|uniref:NlpC/P60 family protein n=1 Tax=Mesohalobacter halotolerans TaxID=1883405 RepID=A0A4U5TPX5_9FLAO|nr:C40 family peptidase [Mesohalobacter halotolerans]MBS3737882.1 C40 family peptidase [Psychroflexus sp.]TKS55498.1 NlpC/P60 family protein [Mesohalobacter halotolerans]